MRTLKLLSFPPVPLQRTAELQGLRRRWLEFPGVHGGLCNACSDMIMNKTMDEKRAQHLN